VKNRLLSTCITRRWLSKLQRSVAKPS